MAGKYDDVFGWRTADACHALSADEREHLLRVANEACFADVPPARDPVQRAEQAPQAPPRRADIDAFKLGDTVGFTDKHLRERIGTITRMNTKTYSLICDGKQWRVSPGLLRKIIDL